MTDSVQFQWGFNTDLLQFLSGFSVYSVGVLYSVDAATVWIQCGFTTSISLSQHMCFLLYHVIV